MKRIAFHTLGCKLNYAETAAMGKQFTTHGYTVVDMEEPADVVVINTCSVTAQADRECRHIVRKALRHSPDAFIAVVGCSAQLHAQQLADIHGVDLVVGSQDKFSLFRFVDQEKKKNHADILVSCIDDQRIGSASSAGFEDRTRAFLKVQDGCDFHCTYCTVPLARGGSRSVNLAEIVLQAREAVALGYKEIVLTGVNVGDYGRKNGTTLLALLQQLVLIDGLVRIRISSIEPNLLTDELLDFWTTQDKVCNHWHIPLQSGSDSVLRAMKRRYSSGLYAERVAKIKSLIPNAGIGADVIVGFPGENDILFEETHKFLNDLPVSYFHIFTYSERPNTLAATLNGKNDSRVKMERSKILRQLGNQKRQKFYDTFVGKTVPVLLESAQPDGSISGLTEEYVRVVVKAPQRLTNTIVRVTMKEACTDKCIGTLAESTRISANRIAV
jgi:threonylcarbamoyladenosine tRNA methylthiotransferase MtaB